jgi:hypothetical protein
MTKYLWSYWSAARQDHFTFSTPLALASAQAAGYTRLHQESEVFETQEPNTVPLRLFYSDQRGDNFTTATAQGAKDARGSGYREVDRIEGYIYRTKPKTPSRALTLYWHAQRGDNFLLGHEESEAAAKAAGYVRVRIEGYAPITKFDL